MFLRVVNDQEYLDSRGGETLAASAPRASSPPVSNNPASSPPEDSHPFASPPVNNHPSQSPPVNDDPTSLPGSNHPGQATNTHDTYAAPPPYQEVEAADEFDPRIPVSGTASPIYLLSWGSNLNCYIRLYEWALDGATLFLFLKA